jgi:acyl dehydratase
MQTQPHYRVQARNLSHASENKIHDDAVARDFGFRGGLVPGVEVYAYMTHLPVARWGVEWLERGTAECRFMKPVYDGHLVTVSASGAAHELSILVASEGQHCASGSAALSEVSSAGASIAAGLPDSAPIPEPAGRPDASEITLATGRRLQSRPLHLTHAEHTRYLADIGEQDPVYAREKLVHPAFMLRLANFALKDNVKLGPWIHAASAVAHCGLARTDATLTAHASVAANYERKGHRWVELDVLVVADELRPVAQVRHTAIYHLRHAGEKRETP